jgi:hypothetical protein
MSRFVFKVYVDEKLIGNFTSINHICNNFRIHVPEELWTQEMQKRLIEAFRIPNYARRLPQVYTDDSIALKVVSEYIEQTGYLRTGEKSEEHEDG